MIDSLPYSAEDHIQLVWFVLLLLVEKLVEKLVETLAETLLETLVETLAETRSYGTGVANQ